MRGHIIKQACCGSALERHVRNCSDGRNSVLRPTRHIHGGIAESRPMRGCMFAPSAVTFGLRPWTGGRDHVHVVDDHGPADRSVQSVPLAGMPDELDGLPALERV